MDGRRRGSADAATLRPVNPQVRTRPDVSGQLSAVCQGASCAAAKMRTYFIVRSLRPPEVEMPLLTVDGSCDHTNGVWHGVMRPALHIWTGKAGPMLFQGWVARDRARTRPWDDL